MKKIICVLFLLLSATASFADVKPSLFVYDFNTGMEVTASTKQIGVVLNTDWTWNDSKGYISVQEIKALSFKGEAISITSVDNKSSFSFNAQAYRGGYERVFLGAYNVALPQGKPIKGGIILNVALLYSNSWGSDPQGEGGPASIVASTEIPFNSRYICGNCGIK